MMTSVSVPCPDGGVSKANGQACLVDHRVVTCQGCNARAENVRKRIRRDERRDLFILFSALAMFFSLGLEVGAAYLNDPVWPYFLTVIFFGVVGTILMLRRGL